MKKQFLSLLLLFFPLVTFAAEGETLTQKIDTVFQKYTQWFVDAVFYQIPIAPNFSAPWVVLLLLGGALFFTFYFKFINITGFRTAIQVLRGKHDDLELSEASETDGKTKKTHKKAPGEVSHFQALTTALSATVGLGNIAGVAIALSIGGPGATFWMILGGFLGMAMKFAECTLGVKYRDIGPDGTVYGGPMYYLKKGLSEKGMKSFGKFLSIAFAILITGGAFGIGNMFQANQASSQVASLFNLEGNATIWIGGIMAIMVAFVIIGGIKRIAKVTDKLVPFMAILYVVSALIIIGINYQYLGAAFGQIFDGAFTGTGITGGVVGVMIQGIKRSTFSNEAGLGSAPTAHAAVKTNYAASEGIVALLEPFIDTVVICTMTALIIILSNMNQDILVYGQPISEGVKITAAAFDSAIPHFSIILTVVVFLFAFSTMISWSYYGLQGWAFLFGRKKKTLLIYNILFCIFIWIGSAISLGSVIEFADAMNFAMAIPNIIGIVVLAPVVRKEYRKYMAAIQRKKESKIAA
ncbi:MAG TPA: alanine/glycine:cation symporter family protein [Edaphocola sp.]|nr:alanine/glycine:cation symporter family protein [Edaphocola sp.]